MTLAGHMSFYKCMRIVSLMHWLNHETIARHF
jgi:hypothetical protein